LRRGMHVEKQTNVFFILGYCRDFYFFIYFFTRKTVPFLSGCFFFYWVIISTVYRRLFIRLFIISDYQNILSLLCSYVIMYFIYLIRLSKKSIIIMFRRAYRF